MTYAGAKKTSACSRNRASGAADSTRSPAHCWKNG